MLRATPAARVLGLAGLILILAGMAFSWAAAVLCGWAVMLVLVATAARMRRQPAPTLGVAHPLLVHSATEVPFAVTGDADAFAIVTNDAKAKRPQKISWQSAPGQLVLRWEEAGVRQMPGMRALRRDGMGWWQRTAPVTLEPVTVLPNRRELAETAQRARSVAAVIRGAHPLAIFEDRSSAEGLRNWVEGSSTRFIDWKASSRFESLLEKQFVRVRELDLEIVVDATSAARRKESATAAAPLEVALPTALHVLEWGRAHARSVHVTVAADRDVLLRIASRGSDAGPAVRALVGSLPILLPDQPVVPGDAGATPFQSMLRRVAAGAQTSGLLAACSAPQATAGETALFLVSALDVAPAQTSLLARATAGRTHRVLLQVGDMQGAAQDSPTLERLYQRLARRRRNADLLAAAGWTVVDASLAIDRAAVLGEVAHRVGA